jgi:galactokinase/mevalonate kinase-like predicted kinase
LSGAAQIYHPIYSKFGGFFVSDAVDKFNYIAVKPRFEKRLSTSYSKTEIVERIEDIQQPITREALNLVGVCDGLEIVSMANVPGRSGLGGSSGCCVSALRPKQGLSLSAQERGRPSQEVASSNVPRRCWRLPAKVAKAHIGSSHNTGL